MGDGVPDAGVVEVLAGRGAAEDVLQGGAGGARGEAVYGGEGHVDAAGVEAEDVVVALQDDVEEGAKAIGGARAAAAWAAGVEDDGAGVGILD